MTTTKTKPAGTNFNKYAYAAFVTAGILFFLVKDYGQATIFLGIALVFDPFKVAVKFNSRPTWQRVWLIAHLLVNFAAIGMLMSKQ